MMNNKPKISNLTEKYGCCFAVRDFANCVMLCIEMKFDDNGCIHCTDFSGWTKVFNFHEITQIEHIALILQND